MRAHIARRIAVIDTLMIEHRIRLIESRRKSLCAQSLSLTCDHSSFAEEAPTGQSVTMQIISPSHRASKPR